VTATTEHDARDVHVALTRRDGTVQNLREVELSGYTPTALGQPERIGQFEHTLDETVDGPPSEARMVLICRTFSTIAITWWDAQRLAQWVQQCDVWSEEEYRARRARLGEATGQLVLDPWDAPSPPRPLAGAGVG
jgi:hypothetical protein